jgi:cytochrome c oxidase cbb3-type subunit 2
MKGLAPLFLGIFGTFAFSWVGLTVIPNWQIGHLNPQSDEEGTDIYPQPQSGMVERGARVYAANGCVYCHSQQVRPEYAANDIERKWGDRRSAPRDYIFERPVFLGKMRMGQDLANIGARAPAQEESPAPAPQAAPVSAGPPKPGEGSSPSSAQAGAPSAAGSPVASAAASPTPSAAPWPIRTEGLPPMYSAAWHHVHLYSPRAINIDSNMPAYRFLYEKRRIAGERSDNALPLTGSDAPPQGWEIVPTYDAKCLVAYLMSLNQSHPLKEVRTAAPPAAAGSPAASPAPTGGPAPK